MCEHIYAITPLMRGDPQLLIQVDTAKPLLF